MKPPNKLHRIKPSVKINNIISAQSGISYYNFFIWLFITCSFNPHFMQLCAVFKFKHLYAPP